MSSVHVKWTQIFQAGLTSSIVVKIMWCNHVEPLSTIKSCSTKVLFFWVQCVYKNTVAEYQWNVMSTNFDVSLSLENEFEILYGDIALLLFSSLSKLLFPCLLSKCLSIVVYAHVFISNKNVCTSSERIHFLYKFGKFYSYVPGNSKHFYAIAQNVNENPTIDIAG